MIGGLGLFGAVFFNPYSLPLLLQTPVLPPTITDQIRLWELERDRLRFTEGEWLLVTEFRSLAKGRTVLMSRRVFVDFIFLCTARKGREVGKTLFWGVEGGRGELVAVSKLTQISTAGI